MAGHRNFGSPGMSAGPRLSRLGLPKLHVGVAVGSATAFDHEHPSADVRSRLKRCVRQRTSEAAVEGPLPPVRRRCTRAGPPTCGLVLHHHVSAHQPTAVVDESAEQRARDRERRIGDHAERPQRQAQVGSVGTHHPDVVAEASMQMGHPVGMQLDRDHRRAHAQQFGRQRSGAGADVEDEVAG